MKNAICLICYHRINVSFKKMRFFDANDYYSGLECSGWGCSELDCSDNSKVIHDHMVKRQLDQTILILCHDLLQNRNIFFYQSLNFFLSYAIK
jgi:hypothetical protein